MINSEPGPANTAEPSKDAVSGIAGASARGAVVLAAIATTIVVAMWFVFYLLVFVPRAIAP